jgi:ribosomal protein L29
MKIRDLKLLNEKEIEEKTIELQKELMKLEGQVAVGTAIKNSSQIKNIKKTIAKIYTLKKQRGIK